MCWALLSARSASTQARAPSSRLTHSSDANMYAFARTSLARSFFSPKVASQVTCAAASSSGNVDATSAYRQFTNALRTATKVVSSSSGLRGTYSIRWTEFSNASSWTALGSLTEPRPEAGSAPSMATLARLAMSSRLRTCSSPSRSAPRSGETLATWRPPTWATWPSELRRVSVDARPTPANGIDNASAITLRTVMSSSRLRPLSRREMVDAENPQQAPNSVWVRPAASRALRIAAPTSARSRAGLPDGGGTWRRASPLIRLSSEVPHCSKAHPWVEAKQRARSARPCTVCMPRAATASALSWAGSSAFDVSRGCSQSPMTRRSARSCKAQQMKENS
jgi:hypothetical protein